MVLLINCPSLWSPEKPVVCSSSFLKKCFNHLCLYKESFTPKSKNWRLNTLALNFNTWLNTPLQWQSEVFIPKYKTTKYSVCIFWLAPRLTGLTRPAQQIHQEAGNCCHHDLFHLGLRHGGMRKSGTWILNSTLLGRP